MRRIFEMLLILNTGNLLAEQASELGIDPARITVSGMSSGAQMAHQLHLAYSDLFSGAALLAGGPFGCAEGSVVNALRRCLAEPGTEIPLDTLNQTIRDASADGRLADLENLADDLVWIFHGSLDTAVPVSVNDALVGIYQGLVPLQKMEVVTDIPAAHTFPADGKGTVCDKVESPFVGNCDYDAAGTLLQFLYSDLQQPDRDAQTSVSKVTLAAAKDALLDETAFLFVPPACNTSDSNCALHLVLHGCAQSASQVQMAFIEQSGYLEWAEKNHIVLAFPQAVASMANPLACWDWWGYSGEDYLWRDGKQMKVLSDWIKQLAGL
ncbi:MAG: PHB depolymerase family esterase [Xanthomonadales bacterium]|nr:PHB depolymerase family esterase [Xanthomonadales bacterium]